MSREYITLSKNIIKHLGGQNNINNVYHCQTRLRFSLNDPTKVRAIKNFKRGKNCRYQRRATSDSDRDSCRKSV